MKPEVRLEKRKTWKLGLGGNRSRVWVWRTGQESIEAGLALRSVEKTSPRASSPFGSGGGSLVPGVLGVGMKL